MKPPFAESTAVAASAEASEIEAMCAEDAGKGLSLELVDNAFWLDPYDGASDPWITALEAANKRLDLKPVSDLLRSTTPITENARWYLADLLDRHVIKRRRGRPKTPAYDRTQKVAILELAEQVWKDVDKPKEKAGRDKLRDAIAARYGIGIEQFVLHLNGRLGQSRAPNKRQRPASK